MVITYIRYARNEETTFQIKKKKSHSSNSHSSNGHSSKASSFKAQWINQRTHCLNSKNRLFRKKTPEIYK